MTIRGYLDDPTATIVATVTINGTAVEVAGIVERDGLFWLENVPLSPGENQVTLTLANAAGFMSTETLTLTRSAETLTVNNVTQSQPGQSLAATVSGSISAAGYSVWVNGVKATMNGDGTWSAANVPLNDGGMTTVHAVAIPDTESVF